MVDNLKEKARRAWEQFTPEQSNWLIKALLLTGFAFLWRGAMNLWPSRPLWLIGMALFITLSICYIKLLRCSPSLHRLIKWSIPLFVGGFLNCMATVVNAGFMPSACAQTTDGFYIPMEGARLTLLGDWIWTFVSPGDVLMILGFIGVVATLIRKPERKLVNQIIINELKERP